jgi:hypothetical protein
VVCFLGESAVTIVSLVRLLIKIKIKGFLYCLDGSCEQRHRESAGSPMKQIRT